MPQTKTLWHYVADYDWDTKKFKIQVFKQKFYINPKKPDIYFYDKYMDEGLYKDEVGKVTNFHAYTYHLYSPKLPKNEVVCAFRGYFWDVINRTRDEQTKLMHQVEDAIREQLKEDY